MNRDQSIVHSLV